MTEQQAERMVSALERIARNLALLTPREQGALLWAIEVGDAGSGMFYANDSTTAISVPRESAYVKTWKSEGGARRALERILERAANLDDDSELALKMLAHARMVQL